MVRGVGWGGAVGWAGAEGGVGWGGGKRARAQRAERPRGERGARRGLHRPAHAGSARALAVCGALRGCPAAGVGGPSGPGPCPEAHTPAMPPSVPT